MDVKNCGIAGGRNNNYLDLKEQEKFLTGLQKETIIAHNIDRVLILDKSLWCWLQG